MLKTDKTHHIKKFNKDISVVLLNARSIRNKDQLITDYLLNNRVDLAIITEIWLKNNEADDIWLECCELNQNGYKTRNINRTKRSGGVLLLCIKTHFRLKKQRRENLML